MQGRKIDGGNVFEAPRARDYPLPPLRADQSAILFDRRRAKTRISPFLFAARDRLASLIRAGRAAPIAATARLSAAMSARNRASWSPSCPRPMRPAISNCSPARWLSRQQRQQRQSDRRLLLRPDGSDNTIEADLVILAPFIYDNTRLLLLSKTDKFPNGLANSSGQLGKHLMAHIIGGRAFAAFDDRYVNVYMGPSAQKHSLDDFNADNFDHSGSGLHPRRADFGSTRQTRGGPIGIAIDRGTARGNSALGRRLSRFPRASISRAMPRSWRRPRTCPMPIRRSISIPNVRDAWGLPAPRLTYDWRRPNELRAGRVHAGETRPRSARPWARASLADAAVRHRRAGRAPRRRHPHGQRPEGIPSSTNTARAGTSQSLHHRKLDLPDHGTRLQSDAHDPSAGLFERRCDRQSLQEKAGPAGLAEVFVKSKLALFFGVTAALLMICDLALAHHGSSVSYDTSKMVTMEATVTEFSGNPHVLYLL